MKLYLTSASIKGLPAFIGKSPKDIKLAFIPTAADPYENKWFIDADKKDLKDMGISFFEIDLKGKIKEELENLLQGVDCIYVAGGNTFYLLEKARESGFDEVIKELVNKGIVYAGGSAGAVLVCPSIEPVKFMDDPEKAPNLKDFKGLGLVDFVIVPHADVTKYASQVNRILEEFKDKYKLLPLTNNQVVEVVGDKYEIINLNTT